MSIAFDHPEYLWLLLLTGPIVYLGMRSLKSMERLRRWCAIGLRVLLLLLIVFMLAGIQTVRRSDVMTVIAVLDQSESVRKFAKPPADAFGDTKHKNGYSIEQWQEQLVRVVTEDRKPDDLVSVISYADRPIVRALPSNDPEFQSAIQIDAGGGTNTAAAIRSAIAQARSDSAAKILLCSDLNDENSEEVLAAARDAAVAGIPISVAPVPYAIKNEVAVKNLHIPMNAREGQTVRLRIELEATDPVDGEIVVFYDDQVIPITAEQPGLPIKKSDWIINARANEDYQRFVAIKRIDLPLGHAGINQFKAVFNAKGQDDVDVVAVNNEAEAFTIVRGQGKVLFVDGLGDDSGQILPRSLERHGVELDVISPAQFPGSVSTLQKYDAVIFQSVPSEFISESQQRALVTYVHDLGGGFAMIGGRGSFGAGGWTNSKLDQSILPVNCQIPSQSLLPSGALVLVIDHSGSMSSNVLGSRFNQQILANEAAILALNTLYPQDLVGVVVFDDQAQMLWDVQLNSEPYKLAQRVRSIAPRGGTNIYAGLELAYEKLAPLKMQDAAIKHVILLTDGNSQDGKYVQLVGKMMRSNITLSTVGIGDARQFNLLKQLANMGGGIYHDVQDPNNLPQVFIKEAQTIRKNLIKEMEFVPHVRDADSPLLANFNASPPLKGYVLTGERDDPRVFNALLGPEGEPLLAHMQVGLGRTVAFTSDANNRWAADWLQWGGYEDFWGRIVRYVSRPTQSSTHELLATIEGDRIRLQLDAGQTGENQRRYAKQTSFQNNLLVQGAVVLPDGNVEKVELSQIGPGLYEAETPAALEGNYVFEMQMVDQKGKTARATAGVTRLPGDELRKFQTNLDLAERITMMTGGEIINPYDPKPHSLFVGDRPTAQTMRSVWRYLLAALLILFLMDVANRRIAWDAQEIAVWYRKRKNAKQKRLQRKSVATISSLKQKRDTAVAGMAGDDDALAAAAVTVEAMRKRRKANTLAEIRKRSADKRSKQVKFEASEDQSVSGDLLATMGGAVKEDINKQSQATEQNVPDSADSEDTTSRLLSAKRKAQQSIEQRNQDKQ